MVPIKDLHFSLEGSYFEFFPGQFGDGVGDKVALLVRLQIDGVLARRQQLAHLGRVPGCAVAVAVVAAGAGAAATPFTARAPHLRQTAHSEGEVSWKRER